MIYNNIRLLSRACTNRLFIYTIIFFYLTENKVCFTRFSNNINIKQSKLWLEDTSMSVNYMYIHDTTFPYKKSWL